MAISKELEAKILRYHFVEHWGPHTLCREISGDDTRIQVDIYRGEDDPGWILEVIDEENASTVWDDPFNTDQEALDEVMEVIEKDGIKSFLEGESGVTH